MEALQLLQHGFWGTAEHLGAHGSADGCGTTDFNHLVGPRRWIRGELLNGDFRKLRGAADPTADVAFTCP